MQKNDEKEVKTHKNEIKMKKIKQKDKKEFFFKNENMKMQKQHGLEKFFSGASGKQEGSCPDDVCRARLPCHSHLGVTSSSI